MLLDQRRLGDVLGPDRFFGLEVILGVGHQRLDQLGERGIVMAVGHMAGQGIEDGNQLAVLVVDDLEAGIEVFIPRKDFHVVVTVFHGGHGDES